MFFIVIHKNNIIVRALYYLMVEKLQAKAILINNSTSYLSIKNVLYRRRFLKRIVFYREQKDS